MLLANQGNILGIKLGDDFIGFHASTLDVAEISPEAFLSLNGGSSDTAAAQELREWNLESTSSSASLAAKRSSVTRHLNINVTQICNLHCAYCAAGGDGTYGEAIKKISVERVLPQLARMLQKLQPHDQFQITFMGGEPLLYPHAMKLIADYVQEESQQKEIQSRFHVITNGTLLNDECIEILKTFNPSISISIDGPSEVNDKVRKPKSLRFGTQATIDGIFRLNQSKQFFRKITSISTFNHEHLDVLTTWNFLRQLPLDGFYFDFDYLSLNAQDNAIYIKNMEKTLQAAYELGGETELRKITFADSLFHQLDQKFITPNHCGIGKEFKIMDANGKNYLCHWFIGTEGAEIPPVTGMQAPLAEKLNLSQPLNEKIGCNACWARNICGGGCTFVHRNYLEKGQLDQNYCIRTKALIANVIGYYVKSRQGIELEEGVLHEQTY
jgi:uncharacterized protein